MFSENWKSVLSIWSDSFFPTVFHSSQNLGNSCAIITGLPDFSPVQLAFNSSTDGGNGHDGME